MRYRALDSDGDYSFGKNMQDFLSDTDAVVQAVNTNLKLLQGEWWEDLSEGLPLFQNILSNSGSVDHVKAVDMLIQERILSTQGVRKIVDYISNSENRSYSALCTIETLYGVAPVEVAF